MKVLFAVSNEEISESIVKYYQTEYKQIISSKNVYYFNAILKEIQKDKTYDRIVISEDLEAFTHSQYDQIDKFIFEKLDSISDEASNMKGNDTPIILICADRRTKSEQILVKLFGIGIYNALIGPDRRVNEVCKLLNRPRTKKEAKSYYKIDAEEVKYTPENENDVSEIEIQNILSFYKKLGKDEERYLSAFENIAAQYNDQQLRIISKFLPLNVRTVLEERSTKYQRVMTFNNTISNDLRKTGNDDSDGPSSKLLTSAIKSMPMSNPVVIPTEVKTNNVRKLSINKKENDSNNIVQNQEVNNNANNNEYEVYNNYNQQINEPVVQNNINQGYSDLNQYEVNIPQVNSINNNNYNPMEIEQQNQMDTNTEMMVEEVEQKKGRGRPPKKDNSLSNNELLTATPKRGRGRPPKKGLGIFKKEQDVEEQEQFIQPQIDQTQEIQPQFEQPQIEQTFENYNEPEAEREIPSILPGFEEYSSQPVQQEELSQVMQPQIEQMQEAQPQFEQPQINQSEINQPQIEQTFESYNKPEVEQSIPSILPGFEEYSSQQVQQEEPVQVMQPQIEQIQEAQPQFEQPQIEQTFENYNEPEAEREIPSILPGFEEYSSQPVQQEEQTQAIQSQFEQPQIIQPQTNQDFGNFNKIQEESYMERKSSLEDLVDNDSRLQNPYQIQEKKKENSGFLGGHILGGNSKKRDDYVNTIDISEMLTAGKKVISFLGTSKNGTSFIVNNLAELMSSMGVKTAILDTTSNRNSYYIYTKNEEDLRDVALQSFDNLVEGTAEGIQVNKNLSVFTALPDDNDQVGMVDEMLSTLVKNYSLVLIDTDFNTPVGYFKQSQEIYLVQTLDILTIQPLTAFLRELKAKSILEESKIRIIINKAVKVRGITEKTIIGGMAFYNDPAMSFMTELFDRNTVKYIVIPFEDETYVRYLENIINCEISLKGYSKAFMQSLRELSNMVYPLGYGKQAGIMKQPRFNPQQSQGGNGNFSPSMNNTLNQMKRNY